MLDRFKQKMSQEWESYKDKILVTIDEAKRRISICQQCPGGRFRYLSRQCKECGCFMDIKTKLKIDKLQVLPYPLALSYSSCFASSVKDIHVFMQVS